MKKINNNRVSEILTKVALSDASVKWWEQEIEKALLRLEQLDASLPEINSNKRQQLVDELLLILNRSEIELKIIYEIEKEIEELLSQQKENKKSKNKRKSS